MQQDSWEQHRGRMDRYHAVARGQDQVPTTAERFSSNERMAPLVFSMWVLTKGAKNPPAGHSADPVQRASRTDFSHPPNVLHEKPDQDLAVALGQCLSLALARQTSMIGL